MHAALERFWNALDGAAPEGPDEVWRAQFGTALGEIAANIVRHAHPPGTPPGALHLRLRAYAGGVEAHFTDQGVRFQGDLSSPPPAPEVPDGGGDAPSIPEGGYGLPLVLAAVDRLEYARTPAGENVWRLYKRFAA